MRTYKEIPTLLSKALLGTLSGEEECSLKEWREANPENERLYGSVMNAEYGSKKSRDSKC